MDGELGHAAVNPISSTYDVATYRLIRTSAPKGEQMTDRGERIVTESAQVGPARLEPDAIGAAQDKVIGMANAAPTVSVGLTLAALAATAAYAVGPVILLTAVPMIIIANAYRRLNLWNANCGASFEWVGRAINPYLGFMTGWLMIAGSLVGAISGVVVLAPSVLAIFTASASSTWPNILISTAVILVMLVIAVVESGSRPGPRSAWR
jgi:hypothetical protein